MPLLGLIGYPLSHSFSPDFFKAKFRKLYLDNWDYKLFPMADISELPALIDNEKDLVGFNVTIPHKQAVLNYCDELSEEVKSIGAANFVVIKRNKDKPVLKAFNTDYSGFSASLSEWIKPDGKALILGTGGASKAVQYSLAQMQVDFDIAGRHSELNYDTLKLTFYQLIINCTPVGMKRTGAEVLSELLPLPYEQISAKQYFYDLVYNPSETAMMKRFEAEGAQVKNGLQMLHLQAEKAWEIISGENTAL